MHSIRVNKSVLIKTATALIVWKAAIFGIVAIGTLLLPFVPTFTPFISEYAKRFPYVIGIWGNFDGMHYMSIARHGYEPLKQAFFPLYPILIWCVHLLIRQPYLISALVVSHLFFILTLPFLYSLVQKDGLLEGKKQSVWLLFLAILLVFPTSFFYGAVYNDATFFFLATLSIFFARKDKWFLASLAAGIATLTRLNGLALGIYILAEYLISNTSVEESWSFDVLLRNFKSRLQLRKVWATGIGWVCLVPLSFVGYLAYVQYRFGDWMSLFDSMKIWKQSKLTFPPAVIWHYIKILSINSPHDLNFWVAVLEFMSVIFYCHVLLVSVKKIRLSYWLFIFFSFLIPWCTGTFQGMPRYALHLYPFFLAVAIILKTQSKWVKCLYFVISILIMLFALTLFSRGYFVA